jgi:hypothetical protein
MGHHRKPIFVTGILFLLGLSFATPAAAATFDGEWNVQIASSNAACPSGTSVSIGINKGQVASNNAMVSASGRVADAGNISVTLSSGMKRAVGFGHLAGTSGSGTWRGTMCSGTWTAQRI